MSWTCARCEAQNPEGTRFCGHCGGPATFPSAPAVPVGSPPLEPGTPGTLGGRPAKPVDERRLVTAVFADVSGFTALAERLDPDELHEIIGPLISRLAAIAERYGGYVAKYAGDALLVSFGAPVAREDHAARALIVALRMHAELDEALAELPREARGLKLHVGVNSGWVVAGMFGGEIAEYSILGDAVNLAQRLESVAPPGETYVGELTYRLTGARFDFEPVGEFALKGKEQPVQAWRLVAESVGDTVLDPERGVGRLVGRERELATASELVEGLLEGRGGLLLVTGEAGIGKSRLIHEVRRRASLLQWLDGHCLSYGSSLPYWPYIDLLRRALGIRADDVRAEAGRRLAGALSAAGLPDATPYFAHWLGVTLPGGAEERADVAPEAFRRALHGAVTEWLRALSREAPVLVAIEDLHWADPSTIELTRELVRLTLDEPVGFLLTGRPEAEAAFALMGTGAEPVPTRSITLGPLDEGGIRALVDEVLGGAAPPQLAAAVAQRTGGNPFFAEETVRSLLDAGTVRRNGTWYLEAGWDAASVPPTIEGVLSARIDLLPPTASKVLQTASVIGRVVRRPLLRAVATDVLDLDAAVERLVESAFLDPLRFDGDEALAFHHPLALEVAYSRAVRRRRRELHRQVAEATEALYGAGDHVIDFLARHLYLAEAGEKAVEYLFRAGERSKRLFANDEAVLHLTRGLELLGRLPDTPERARQELRLQAALAPPLIAVRGHGAPEVGRLCERARQLGQQVGATPELFPVLFSLVGFHAGRGHLRQSSEFGEQLMAVAEGAGDPGLVLVASFALGVTLFYRGHLLAARDHLERGLAIYRPEEHGSLALQYVFDPGVGCPRAAARVPWVLGFPDRALASATEALVLAKQGSHPYGLALASAFFAMLHQYRRDVGATREQAEATIALAGEHGFPLLLAWARILQAWALVEEASSSASQDQKAAIGQLAAELSGNVAAYEQSGSQILGPYWTALATEARRRAGETEEALSLVARGLEMAEDSDQRSWEAELWRLRGELLHELAPDRDAEAEVNLRRALAIAARQGARGLELRAALSLGRLWRSQGRTKEARETLAGVYASFVEGFDTEDLRAAATLLGELGDG